MKWTRFFLALSTSVMSTGCGGSSQVIGESVERAALLEVGEVYRAFSVDHNKPPQSLKDIATLRPVGPTGIQAIENGTIVLLYGATMTDLNEGPASAVSDQILAYEKKTPESGGEVLFLDRRVKTMSVDEFKAAPKAVK